MYDKYNHLLLILFHLFLFDYQSSELLQLQSHQNLMLCKCFFLLRLRLRQYLQFHYQLGYCQLRFRRHRRHYHLTQQFHHYK
jgi:hypothetical protein